MSELVLQAEQLRARAAVCFARSKELHDPMYQRIFYELAIEWLAMAAEAEFQKEVRSNNFRGNILHLQLGARENAERLAELR
jgi:hypothetical protein